MRDVRLIAMPFHNGLRGVGMGRGATALAHDEGLRAAFEAQQLRVADVFEVEAVDESRPEIARTIELIRRLARAVRSTTSDGLFPLVLAGSCNSSLGTVAGIGASDLGVVWLDAHADFDDPEENTSGFFDVMGLAMLTGRGWSGLRDTIPGHEPVAERSVLLAAVRDLEPYQRARMEQSELLLVGDEVDESRFDAALAELASRASRVYLHVDLDSLDDSVARANEYAAPGGPTLERVCACVHAVCERFTIAAAAFTAYDPAFDDRERTRIAARRIAAEIASGIAR
jgi:arginase